MWPFLFGLKTYTFLYIGSFITHAAAALLFQRRARIKGLYWLWLGLAFALGMTTGAKILFNLQHGGVAWRSYFTLGHYLAGGMWGGPLAYFAIAVPLALCYRRDRRRRLDITVIALVPAMILAKTACLANGCCWGEPSTLPWAVAFPEGAACPPGIPRHPTALYEIIVLLAIAVILGRLDRHPAGPRAIDRETECDARASPSRWEGLLIFWFVALYGIGRPLTEVFRGDGDRVPAMGPFTASQAVCLAAACVAVVLLVYALRRASQAPANDAI